MEGNAIPGEGSKYDKAKEVKAFDETKAGVKGLVDNGVKEIPRFFVHPPENEQNSPLLSDKNDKSSFEIPVIDMEGFESCRRKEIVEEIRKASETWGLFQMVNHGVPMGVMDDMLAGVREFHEGTKEEKMKWYSRDTNRRVRYFSNGDLLVSKAPANWRDTLAFYFPDGEIEPQLFPEICREAVREYMKEIIKLRRTVAELLSEALGLRREHLISMDCMETESLTCHYYPACPQPELTLGATRHTDPSFLTILLQDDKGGLQVCTRNQWVDVPPLHGALVVNIGDLMQLITNEKFISVEHRVRVGSAGSRASAACFFYPSTANNFKPYGALKELLLSDNAPIYRDTHFCEFMSHFKSKGLDAESTCKQKTSSTPFSLVSLFFGK
ncbi:hypothetical protein K2173_026295 [Erythroxylum novogranatense]|uniref:Fe2OG dioxygenase domain-containing protein n=1 Tax=Erythroxylum novogranatense TaxID=1862640 RepID=A0AAV8SBQ9_9ROSI|nr:hypothetical protein K2173_026295 [Erythroxylum novogranatense]